MKTKLKIAISLTGAILLVVLGTMLSFRAFHQIEDAVEARKRTSAVLHSTNALLSELRDAETGQRGYALTGNESFLEPYLAVRDRISGHLNELRQLSTSAAQKELDALPPLVTAKMAEMAQVIQLRRHHDLTAVLAVVGSGEGKRLMDSIRAKLGNVVRLEEGVLARHETEFQRNMRNMFGFIVVANLMTLLFALLFAFWIYRESQHRLHTLIHRETEQLLKIQEETNQQLSQANTTLHVSQEKLAVTLNSIGDGVIATDAAGMVTLLNPVAEQLTGWSQGESDHRPVNDIFQIINQETRYPATIPVAQTLAQGTIQGLANHTILIARDGSERPIADSCAPIRDREGRVVGAVLVFRDVTEEYAAQQALSDSAAFMDTLLESMPVPVFYKDTEGRFLGINKAFEQLCDRRRDDLVGKSLQEISPPEPAKLSHAKDLELIRNPGVQVYEEMLQDAQGVRHDVVYHKSTFKGADGNVLGLIGVILDISAQKRSEEALFKAGALQNAIFNSANFSSIATDARGVIQIFNVGAERMLGYAADDVMNKITPADISDPQELIDRAQTLSNEFDTPITPGFEALVFKASRGIEDIYELTYIRKDGSRFPAVVSVTPLRDPQEAIIGYLLIGTDNTARKQIDEEQNKLAQRLRDYQFYTRSLFESNIDALMTTDPSGIITDVNKQMEALTGCTRDELIGAPFRRHFTDEERAGNSIKLVLSEKNVTNYELTARARGGKETVVSLNATTLYDRDRRLQGVFAAARDVTERKRLDLVLLEKNEELENARWLAEKANLAKSEFLSSMSHELRSPLNAILGFAQLLESDPPEATKGQQENITQILQAGWHLLKLINEILDLARIESGQVPLSPEPVSLSEVILECSGMVEPQAQQRGIRLLIPQLQTPYFVHTDRTRVKQILINLLSNAIKYNRAEGTVEVLCNESRAGFTRVSIRDTGRGLNAEQVAQLFQAFNRLGQEAGCKEGTGIGLVVAKRLIELMGGVIGVESSVGVGSVFWFELISVAAPQLSPKENDLTTLPRQPAPHPAQGRTLLYVEDNPANLRLVVKIIARHPELRLLTAVDAVKGFEIARESLPDVILMDINLPGIDGYEAVGILRSDPATRHIPVIALSANAMPREIEKGKKAGFFRYIIKPIKVNEFMEVLMEALEATERGIS